MHSYVVLQDYYLKSQSLWLEEGMTLYPDDLEPDVFPVLVAQGVLEMVNDEAGGELEPLPVDDAPEDVS